MARGRMMNTTVATDLRLNELSLEAHWAYMMAIPHLDRDGIMLGHPQVVAGRICPLRPKIGGKMAAIIQEWVNAGLVISYQSENGPVLYFTGFQKNQNFGAAYAREGKSIFDPPPGYIRTETGLIPEEEYELLSNSEPTHELVGVTQALTRARAEVKDQVEVKDQERGGAMPPPARHPAIAIFHSVWDRYPNKLQTETITSRVHDLDLWLEACQAWANKGHKPTNVEGMLDFYDHPDRFRTPYKAHHLNGTGPPLTEAEKSKLITRANTARGNLRTAEKFGSAIDPQWQRDIDAAKEHGLL